MNKLLLKLQTVFGINRSELIVSFLIVGGLLFGTIFKLTLYKEKNQENISEQIYLTLDSLANAQKSSFIGTDIRNNPIPELAKKDTIWVEPEKFSDSKPKQLPNERININTCSKVELMKLPGVGEATAMKIVEQREKELFKLPEDIMKIKGIGKKKYEKMKDYIKIE